MQLGKNPKDKHNMKSDLIVVMWIKFPQRAVCKANKASLFISISGLKMTWSEVQMSSFWGALTAESSNLKFSAYEMISEESSETRAVLINRLEHLRIAQDCPQLTQD